MKIARVKSPQMTKETPNHTHRLPLDPITLSHQTIKREENKSHTQLKACIIILSLSTEREQKKNSKSTVAVSKTTNIE
jgi:hypothetical protein